MSACSVCSHPDRLAIEQDLLSEPVAWGALRRKYGLKHHLALVSHKREHMAPAIVPLLYAPVFAKELQPMDIGLRYIDAHEPQIIEDPMTQFTEAWQLAKDDTKTQRRMMSVVVDDAVKHDGLKRYLYDKVKEVLQSDEMGLP